MLHTFLLKQFRGITANLGYLINGIFISLVIILICSLKPFLPQKWRLLIDRFIHHKVLLWWAFGNISIARITSPTKFTVIGADQLTKKEHYFLVCNHQSWADILILQRAFGLKIPNLAFFMKKSLLWTLPIIGLACWYVGFPLMQRPSKNYLKKHPEKKNQDQQSTEKFCNRFKNFPITMVNYIESTRFTLEKRELTGSPYKHLLKPKASSFALALNSMQGILTQVINATIIYVPNNHKLKDDKHINFWDYACGYYDEIKVLYEVIDVKDIPIGNYLQDRTYRTNIQTWLNNLWQKKDQKF